MIINYDLSSITAVHIIDKGAFQSISNFTPASIERINWFNQAMPVWKPSPSGKKKSEAAPVQKKKVKRKRIQHKERNELEQTKSRFTCQGKKHCSEMRSCAEAKFYLRNCPGVKIDGDNDGIPCEDQWCRWN
jgi:hypothetical protein